MTPNMAAAVAGGQQTTFNLENWTEDGRLEGDTLLQV